MVTDEPLEDRDETLDAHLVPPAERDDDPVIESKRQLVEYLEFGCKPHESFRLGAEQEQFVYHTREYSPAVYDGPNPGIRSLLESLQQFGWQPITENELPVALQRGFATVTLEPGGQIELSGAPLSDAHQTLAETRAFHTELRSVSQNLGLSFLALGHQPRHPPEQLPWMPKQRYRIMRAWMRQHGALGLDMMQATCSIQVTVDFSSEADMVKKFRVALALQPVVTALFANSPFVRGQLSGYVSYRSKVWGNTDSQRCGSLPFVFEQGMGFERYTDYVLDVPMYFVCRDGEYLDASGLSFRDFLHGRLPVLPGQQPLLSDWVSHLTTVFPNVRLKRYLEMRGADAGDAMSRVPALAALWAGILYDSQSLDAAWERVSNWTFAERQDLERGVAKRGFNTPFRRGTARDLALWLLDLSRQGLGRRNVRNQHGQDEGCFLQPLQDAAQLGGTFAEQLVRRYDSQWQRDMRVGLPAMCQETLS